MSLTTVVVPWRGGCPDRERALDWVRARYARRHPSWRVVVAEAPAGPWVKAHALFPAFPPSGTVVVADADVWVPGLEAAVAHVRAGAPWAMPHRLVHRLTPAETARVLDGAEPHGPMACTQRPYRGTPGGGILVAPAQTLRTIPPDPRFEGWGAEDLAWGIALAELAGQGARGTEPLFHLHHPPQERLGRQLGSHDSAALADRYRAARGDQEAMRHLIGGAVDRLRRPRSALRGPPRPDLAGAPR